MNQTIRHQQIFVLLAAIITFGFAAGTADIATAQEKKPNILVIWGEKATCWEGGFRVPCVVRWPGNIPAGKVCNGIVSHEDWMPTLLAAAGTGKFQRRQDHQADGSDTRW